MSNIAVDKEVRPPFVQFERRETEDRAETIAQGRYCSKMVDIALITPHGSRDSVEREVSIWFPYLEEQVKQGRMDPRWVEGWKHGYGLWQKGEEIPLNGTPIRTWPAVNPGQAKLLVSLHVLTVEDLAAANDELLNRIGMGSVELKRRAADFLKEAAGPGKLVAEVAALRVELAMAQARSEGLEAANRELLGRLNQLMPPLDAPVAPPEAVARAPVAFKPTPDVDSLNL